MTTDTLPLNDAVHDTCYIYQKYKEKISEIIAYIEVYEHDLPANIMAQMAELFQAVATFEIDNHSLRSDGVERMLKETDLKITQSLYKHSIYLFMKKIYQYKKIFRKFKCRGVLIEKENFCEKSKKEEKEIVRMFRKKVKRCYKRKFLNTIQTFSIGDGFRYFFGYIEISLLPSSCLFKQEVSLPADDLITSDMEEVDLSGVYTKARTLIGDYEKVFPQVISNGANKSRAMSIFVAISSWIIPVLLSVPVIMKIVDALKGLR